MKPFNVIELLNEKIENFYNKTGIRPTFIIVDAMYYNRICFDTPIIDSLNKNYQLKNNYQDITIILISDIDRPYLEVIGNAEFTYLNKNN